MPARPPSLSEATLRASARGWFLTAVLGQWIFAGYVALFYGRAALQGRWEAWNQVFPRGHVPGDGMGNAAVAAHLLLALLILVGGPLQLIPGLRTRFPAFHRWTGRLYLGAMMATSLAGLYLVWVRGGTTGDLYQHLGITLDALLILAFSVLALRTAIARRFDAHRRWALRLYLAGNAVWFFRLGLTLSLLIFRRPVGFDPKTFSGPLLTFLAFAQTLLPLAVLELYLRARDRAGGIFAATMILWRPHF
jgi:uncharacterized membrane protein